MRGYTKLVFLCAFAVATSAYGQYERPGSTDAQFLKIGVSARAAGMADAYIAVTRGAESVHYNPAALAWIEGTAISFNHTRWFAGINHEFAAVAHTFGRHGSFAISMTSLYTDEMKVRTPLQPDGTGETFYAGNLRVGVSYARYLTDRVTFGGSVNYIYMSLYKGFEAHAWAADIAVLYVTHFRGFCFGMKVANFGTEVKFVNEEYPLPTTFTFGLAMNAIQTEHQKLLVSVSAFKPNDGKPLGQIGTEWSYRGTLYLRAGYRINHEVARFAFGGGVSIGVAGYQLSFDYAYSDFMLLGAAHRFGANLYF